MASLIRLFVVSRFSLPAPRFFRREASVTATIQPRDKRCTNCYHTHTHTHTQMHEVIFHTHTHTQRCMNCYHTHTKMRELLLHTHTHTQRCMNCYYTHRHKDAWTVITHTHTHTDAWSDIPHTHTHTHKDAWTVIPYTHTCTHTEWCVNCYPYTCAHPSTLLLPLSIHQARPGWSASDALVTFLWRRERWR